MKEILVITNSYPNASNMNSGIFVHEQLKVAKDYGYSITVINPVFEFPFLSQGGMPSYKNSDHIDGIDIYYPKYVLIPKKMGYNFTVNSYIKAVINCYYSENINKPDLIHSHWATPAGIAGVELANMLSIPLLTTLRGSDIYTYPNKSKKAKEYTNTVLKSSEKVFCVSEALKNKVKEDYNLDVNLDVLYNGIDIDSFVKNEKSVQAIKDTLKFNEKEKIILFVGRLIKEKGVWELVKSIEVLSKNEKNIRLIMIGNGKEQKSLKKYVEKNGLGKYIHFPGKVPYKELKDWYNASEILVLPSYSEGLPNVVVEALGCETAVIATDVGGNGEIINEKNGILIPVKDIKSIVSSVSSLLNNEEIRISMGIEGRKFVEKKFNRGKNVEKLVEIYGKL
ncbi:glycosyltransferase [Planococcus sp. A6]|uniref:glycosyltransferase n=1 Tax=Planococcus sp. A6 TaxID=2992760 RepID=UPI00237AE2C6|nr:glycosyltransferase [Planococcus sp. A6]MDE0582099.1 glycosyltransferase [Planococcus sp. A6]